MTPHELLRCTPATNCGACGYPACLAFAVAVTRGGLRPELCPYLQRDKLPAELLGRTADSGAAAALERGEEERLTALAVHLRAKMQGLDLQNIAPRLGAKCEADFLSFSFLGRQVRLSTAGVFVDGGQPADPRDQILLYNYVFFGSAGSGRMPDGTWIGMESLPNSIAKVRTLSVHCEDRLAERFSGQTDRLAAACMKIGATVSPAAADLAMIVPVLPRVPFLLLFWDQEPEDGFAAKVKILFDHHVLDFFDLESLVFAAERTADHLLEIA